MVLLGWELEGITVSAEENKTQTRIVSGFPLLGEVHGPKVFLRNEQDIPVIAYWVVRFPSKVLPSFYRVTQKK